MLAVLDGLLFLVGEDGLTKEELSKILDIEINKVDELLFEYKKELEDQKRGLKLVYLGNRYKLTTKEEHKKYYEQLIDKTISGCFSQSALETLAIIAYNGPISVGQIDEIRGVASRDMVRKLLYRGLIDVAGKSNLPGKPVIYNVTDKFLDYFNLASLNDLPELKEVEEIPVQEQDLFLSKYNEKS